MKKILLVAALATLIAAGCEKTEIINQQDGATLSFSTNIDKLTKSATGSGIENLQAQGFKVSAINAYEDIYTTAKEFNNYYDGMKNLPFEYIDNAWTITTGESYFWPGTGKDLVFLALSSMNAAVEVPEIADGDGSFNITGTDAENDGTYTGIAVNNFTIPDYTVTAPVYAKETTGNIKVGTQTGADDDLLVANVVIQNQGDTDDQGAKGKVKLQFNHTLSKVAFVFTTSTTDKYPVTVNKVEISGVINKATLGVDVEFATDARTSTNTYDWSPEEETTLLAQLAADNATTFTIDYNLGLTSGQDTTYATWLVIPQSIDQKMVSITYTITDKENTEEPDKTFTSVFPLFTENLKAWSRNQSVKYRVNLSPNLITFDPSIENDWEDYTGNDTSLNN